ncbi:MAG: glycoside hydrolase family 32 protein [Bryobacteraceae bacterium]
MVPAFLLLLTLNAQEAAIVAPATAAAQRYRPLVHFSPERNWTNDPCGLYFLDGFYHLFFQYNPHGDQWGHMSWGHASTPDLFTWKEHPVALPEENGVMMFTGSAVVDRNNSSGICADDSGCPILIYTGHESKSESRPRREHQNLAAGDRKGMTWRKYSGNPVLNEERAEFRDPKVFWHERTHRWIMVVALANEHKAGFYASRDLKDWKKLSEFGPAGTTGPNWECPEFFELPVEGGTKGETRWVLKIGIGDGHVFGGSGEQYFVGRFDGTSFVNDNPASTTLWFDHGRDCYCTLAFANTPKRPYVEMLGWMSNWSYAKDTPTTPFRGQMTIPRRVSLRKTREGIRIVQRPAVNTARGRRVVAGTASPDAGPWMSSGIPPAFQLDIETPPGYKGEVGVRLSNSAGEWFTVGYDRAKQEWFADRTAVKNVNNAKFASRAAVKRVERGPLRLQILVDVSSVEMFASRGEVSMTHLLFPSQPWNRIDITGDSGAKFETGFTRLGL